MRIGTNHGSLSDRIMNRYGDTPEGMVQSGNRRPTSLAHHSAAGTRQPRLFHFFSDRYEEAYQRELDHFVSVVSGAASPRVTVPLTPAARTASSRDSPAGGS